MRRSGSKNWPQYLLTILCNIGTLTFGLHLGWLAPLHLRFTSGESPLGHGVPSLSTEEISWIGSIPAISFIFGTSIYGFLLQRIGRRASALLAVLPNFLSFLILIFAIDVRMIYAARFIAGMASAGSILITPVYVNESTDDQTRGFLCGLSGFFVNIGVVISVAAGGYLPYRFFNAICMSFSLIFMLFYAWLPETPIFLMARGRRRDAVLALKRLNLDIRQLENHPETATRKSIGHYLSDRAFTRALAISLGVMSIHQLSGCSSITAYSAKVFHESGSSIPPVRAALATSSMLVFGSILGAFLMDKTGRKSLLLISLITMGTSLMLISGYLYLRKDFQLHQHDWIPSIALFAYMIAFATGVGSVSFVLITELFRPEIRGISGAISGTWTSVIGFFTNKFFPIFLEEFTLAPVLLSFLAFCFIGAVFVCFFVVETKGKSTNEIMNLLQSKGSEKDEIEMQNKNGVV